MLFRSLLAACTLASIIVGQQHKQSLGIIIKDTGIKGYPNEGHSAVLFHLRIPDTSLTENKICHDNCSNDKYLTLQKLLKKAEFKLERSIKDFKDILQGFHRNKHDKRGLLDVFGAAQKYLFGVATEADIKEVYSHMSKLYENFSKATTKEISEHLAKMGGQLDTRFQMISHELQMTSHDLDNINAISREHRAAINSLIKEQDLLVSETLPTLESYHQRNTELRTWIQGLFKLQQGYLPIELIHTNALQRAHQRLQDKLQSSKSRAHVLCDKEVLNTLYNIINSNGFIIKDQLFILATFPYVIPEKLMQIYSVQTYPVPVQRSHGYTRLQTKTEYIAVTTDRRYFLEISKDDFELCKSNYFHCPSINHLQFSTSATCVSAILFNYEDAEIMRLCKFQIYDGRLPRNIVRINDSAVLFQSDESFADIICVTDPPSRITLVQSQIINIPCNCYIATQKMRTTLRFCEASTNLTITYPENTPTSFWLKDEIRRHHLTHLNHPDSTHLLPNLGQAINHTAALDNSDPEFGADLEQVLIKVRKLANQQDLQLLTDKTAITNYGLDYGQIIVYSVIFLWLLTVSGIQLQGWLNMRALRGLVLVQIPGVKSAAANPLFTPPAIPETKYDLVTKDLLVIYGLGCLGILLVGGFLVKILCRKIRVWKQNVYRINQGILMAPQASNKMELFLRLSDGYQFITLYLQTIPYDIQDSSVSFTPNCDTPMLEFGLQPTLRLAWEDNLRITLTGHNIAIPLREKIPISYSLITKLRNILASQPPKYNLLGRIDNGSFIALPKGTSNNSIRNETIYPHLNTAHSTSHLGPPAYE